MKYDLCARKKSKSGLLKLSHYVLNTEARIYLHICAT